MTSPLSKGLFQRAIGQSGTVLLAGDPLVLPQAEKRGEAAAARWAGPRGRLPRSAPGALHDAAQILEAEPDLMRNVDPARPAFPNLGITVDGYVFPRKPADAFAAEQRRGLLSLLGTLPTRSSPTPVRRLTSRRRSLMCPGPLAARAEPLYGGTDPVHGTAAAQWATDTSFRCPTIAQVALACGRRPCDLRV